jgi:hypothetical protein
MCARTVAPREMAVILRAPRMASGNVPGLRAGVGGKYSDFLLCVNCLDAA